MPREKNFAHLMGHIIYIILYLSLILLTTLFYNSANLQIVLYVGWLLLVLGVFILFGDAYKNYMKSVSRMNLFAGIFRQLTGKIGEIPRKGR